MSLLVSNELGMSVIEILNTYESRCLFHPKLFYKMSNFHVKVCPHAMGPMVFYKISNNGVLQWLPPIKVAPAISLTLRNRLAPIQSKRRYVRKVFRATSKFHSKEVWDCVKVAVEGSDANVKLYFGRCLAFFCDIKGDHYVALRWFETCNGDNNVLDPIVQMPQLQLACSTKLSSYGVMPVSAILNGALLIPSSNKFDAMQSPREQRVYVKLNS